MKCGACAVVVGVGRVEVRHCRDPSRGGRRRRGDSSHRGRQLNITFEPDPHKRRHAPRPYEKSETKRPPRPRHHVGTAANTREIQPRRITDGSTRARMPKPNARDRTHTSHRCAEKMERKAAGWRSIVRAHPHITHGIAKSQAKMPSPHKPLHNHVLHSRTPKSILRDRSGEGSTRKRG